MFWVAAFLVAGGTYYVVDRIMGTMLPFVLAAVVGGFVLTPIIAGVLWLNDVSGIEDFLVGSFQTLSGVDTPGQVAGECGFNQEHDWRILIGVVDLVPHIVFGLVAIIGLPISLVLLVLSGFYALIMGLVEKDFEDPLDVFKMWGLLPVTISLGSLLLFGFNLRFLNWLTTDWACVPAT